MSETNKVTRKRTAEQICNEDVLLRETLALEKRDIKVFGGSASTAVAHKDCETLNSNCNSPSVRQSGSREPDQKQTKGEIS